MNVMTATPLYGQERESATLSLMPTPNPPDPDRRFRIVELIRLFTEGKNGHPLYGIAALLVIGPIPATVAYLIFR